MTVDYEAFVAHLKKPEAAGLTAHLKQFLVKFNETPNILQAQRKLVASFLDYIYAESSDHPAFRGPAADDLPDVENIREGWEKLIMSKIFDRVFTAPGTDETRSNLVLQRKIESFAWIDERHLDIPMTFNLSLEIAQAELLRINGFKSPRDKLVILQNVLQIVVDLIKKNTRDGESAGNDNLLPTLILVVIRANPPNMISNIKYIMRFRNAQELEKGPNQYCMTNVMGAISFIYNMTGKSLTLTDAEKQRLGMDGSQSAQGSQTRLNGSNAPNTTGGAGELNRIAGQVSNFFGKIFTEVKTISTQAADEIAGFVASSDSPTTTTSAATSAATTTTMSAAGTPASAYPATTPDASIAKNGITSMAASPAIRTMADQEEFELQLALALSLSESGAQATKDAAPRGAAQVSSATPNGDDGEPSLIEAQIRAIDEAVERRKREQEAAGRVPVVGVPPAGHAHGDDDDEEVLVRVK
ncbi:hypothetical protein BC831DRAFT_441745 [Entophlyctis helioformis]|nr:hypothetical protein BC831DRAFT_441745 [Entophlyctis helioformis]